MSPPVAQFLVLGWGALTCEGRLWRARGDSIFFPKPVGTASGGSHTKAFRNIFVLTVTMWFAVVVDIMWLLACYSFTFMNKLASRRIHDTHFA